MDRSLGDHMCAEVRADRTLFDGQKIRNSKLSVRILATTHGCAAKLRSFAGNRKDFVPNVQNIMF